MLWVPTQSRGCSTEQEPPPMEEHFSIVYLEPSQWQGWVHRPSFQWSLQSRVPVEMGSWQAKEVLDAGHVWDVQGLSPWKNSKSCCGSKFLHCIESIFVFRWPHIWTGEVQGWHPILWFETLPTSPFSRGSKINDPSRCSLSLGVHRILSQNIRHWVLHFGTASSTTSSVEHALCVIL